mmetsp:Transcript_5211/g.15316  ORF Transcript_5211/g.15316 Transcript_5211/m.15316 type:complete len:252 (-) Transcript_5211:853-1608(-)|eukprot:CAMPEP_0118975378 /NCGR_PEP_ID=MMETSP1173-20130426/15497_1 /TAXON_ID=1034831 /ORGANISM="Rhizochromulina marina cf, Strain CCMP1243" /LENGTH=251 /DNA_ID=CAMNT_0006925255 /DNA_START=21 /DNA_END=776 /DNA_ORIENTATION=+
MSGYQHIDAESKDEVTGAAVGLIAAQAKSFVRDSPLLKMKNWVGDGPVTFRVLCLVGGLLMVFQGFFGFIGHFFTLSPLHAVIEVYMAFFGCIIIVLEGRNFLYPQWLRDVIGREAKFLTLLNGRGGFYFFLGTLLLSQWPDLGDSILGLYMMSMGLVMLVVGSHAKSKLDRMKNHLTDEATVRREFDRFDADKSGSLSITELAELCKALNSELDKNELEASLIQLDKNGDGSISFDEFLAWWKGTSSLVY